MKQYQSLSLGLAISLHVILGLLLLVKFQTTIKISAPSTQAPKPIIEAVAVNETELQKEVQRLDQKEKVKRDKERQAQEALAVKRKQEEQRIALLKKEQETLKKQQEKAKKEQLEKERLAKEKLAQEQAELAQLKAEKEKALKEKQKREDEAQKQAELEKKQNQEKEKEAEEQKRVAAAQEKMIQDQIHQYAALIQSKINQHWRQPMGIELQGFKCKLRVRLSPDGEVIEAAVVESSGNLEFDRSSELAVRKASPLPLPEDKGALKAFMKFTFTFNPEAA